MRRAILFFCLCNGAINAGRQDSERSLPLNPERRIQFATDEGTWLSLDLSPNGQTIVFEILGDLYSLPISGGRTTRLTSGMAFDTQPRFSPDGRLIVFVSDRDGADNVWVARADGTAPFPLTRERRARFISPTWTPDGLHVIVSRALTDTFTLTLWVVAATREGGPTTGEELAPSPRRPSSASPLGATVSPDGRFVYMAKAVRDAEVTQSSDWQIARFDLANGDEEVLSSAPGGGVRPAISPDGTLLVYGSRRDGDTGLRVRNLDTGDERWLLHATQRDEREATSSRFGGLYSRDLLPGYAFTPDGTSLIAAFGGKIHRIDISTGATRQIPFSADVEMELGPLLRFSRPLESGVVRAKVIQSPSQSPDGKHLAFSALGQVYVMTLPDGVPRRLTTSNLPEFQPSWAPDGRSIAFVTWTSTGGHIWSTSIGSSSSPKRLTETAAYYRDIAWSPDATYLVALRRATETHLESSLDLFKLLPAADMDLVRIPAHGGMARKIARGYTVSALHFAGKPTRLFAMAGSQLISMALDGSGRRRHADFASPRFGARVSPDGRWVLVSTRMAFQRLYVVPLPPAGATRLDPVAATAPFIEVTSPGADYPSWADNGGTVTWSIGAEFRRRRLSDVIGDAVEQTRPESIHVSVEAPRARPTGTVVFRGGRLLTMRGNEVIEDGEIVITNNRIQAIGRRGSLTLPPDATVFDVKRMTIIPGFIDAHAHWTIRHEVLDLDSWDLLASLAYGVTSGRDPSSYTPDIFVYSDLVDSGRVLGPRVFSTGPAITDDIRLKSQSEAEGIVERYKIHYGVETVKSYRVGNRQERQWIVQASAKHKVMATTEGSKDTKLQLTHAIDGYSGNEHNFPTVPVFRDVVELFARSGIYYTPTLLIAAGGPYAKDDFFTASDVHGDLKLRRFVPHSIIDGEALRRAWFHDLEHIYPKAAAAAAQIVRAGGRVCLGSHGELPGLGSHWELWALTRGGLTPHEALRAATLHGAEALGHGSELGSLEPGKLADLLVLTHNPVEDIRNSARIRYVMKNGELFDANTLHRVWPSQRRLPQMWWQQDDGVTPSARSTSRKFGTLRARPSHGGYARSQ